MHRAIIVMIFGGLAAILAGCASMSEVPSCCWIAPPDIHLTGQKTIVERQVVGDYRELEKDAWVVSSAKTNVSARDGLRDEEMLSAFSVREDNRVVIRKYKDEGAMGEANTGYLSYIGTPVYDREANLKKSLMTVLSKENDARKTIFRRTLVKAGIASPSEEQVSSFGKRFAEEQRAFAREKDWIQENNGKWVRK
jgi:uncharacterized protein YdbL (DUF1318 family)